MTIKRLCALALCLALIPSCALAGMISLAPRRSQLNDLSERLDQLRSATLPDPSRILGAKATLYLTDYRCAQDWICDGYTFAQPEDWDAFLSEYSALAERAGFKVSKGVEDGMDVVNLRHYKKRAMLVPHFQGSLLLLVEKGLQFEGAAQTAAEPAE